MIEHAIWNLVISDSCVLLYFQSSWGSRFSLFLSVGHVDNKTERWRKKPRVEIERTKVRKKNMLPSSLLFSWLKFFFFLFFYLLLCRWSTQALSISSPLSFSFFVLKWSTFQPWLYFEITSVSPFDVDFRGTKSCLMSITMLWPNAWNLW